MRTETDIRRMRPGDRAPLPTLSALWGGSFFLNAMALRGLAAPTAASQRAVRPHPRRRPQFLILGACMTNAGPAVLFILFDATALGIAFPGEPFTPRLFFGILIVSGAALLTDERLRPSRRQS